MQNFDNVSHIIRDIQKKIKAKHGIDLKQSEIKQIINSQFKNFKKYTEQEEDIKIDYVGKFKIKPMRRFYLNQKKEDAN